MLTRFQANIADELDNDGNFNSSNYEADISRPNRGSSSPSAADRAVDSLKNPASAKGKSPQETIEGHSSSIVQPTPSSTASQKTAPQKIEEITGATAAQAGTAGTLRQSTSEMVEAAVVAASS